MPELVLQKFRYENIGKVCDDKNIISTFSIDEPDDEVWNWGISLAVKTPLIPKTIYFSTAESQEATEDIILQWSEKEDPFTQVDLHDYEEKRIQELIFRIRTSRSITHRERLASRLFTLNNDAKEEDSTGVGIALNSLLNFYNFLQLLPDLKYPSVSLTPEYNIYISWRGERHQVFSIHFLSGRDTRFVILKPNERHPEKQIQVSGTMTTDILMEKVEPYSVWEWIRNERG
ncbi:MAG: hypothetical protein IIA61_03225 [Candidatus Marinimicrobia bacterium]|nr:hypothetical protein [Candidatus Neomarinimicrobiota bacterium]